jgi:hypothetical protein
MHALAAALHELWMAWSVYTVNACEKTMDPGLVASMKSAWKPYSELSPKQKAVRLGWAKRVQSSMPKAKKTEPGDPRAKALATEFQEMCHQINGFKPEISWAIEVMMIKNKLATYTPEDIKREFDWFLTSDLPKKLGCTIKLALSNYVFNKWLQDNYGG